MQEKAAAIYRKASNADNFSKELIKELRKAFRIQPSVLLGPPQSMFAIFVSWLQDIFNPGKKVGAREDFALEHMVKDDN